MTALLLVNPKARQIAAAPGLPEVILGRLRAAGVEADLHLTTRAGEAVEIAGAAAGRGYDTVIVAGGDGTVNEAVNGLVGSEVALGVIPLGTGNVLGHALGLPAGDVAAACRLVAEGRSRSVDVGQLNGRHFACMAGVGLDAEVAARTTGPFKRLLGTHAFVAQFLATLARSRPLEYEAEIDGQALSGRMWALFVCNTPQYSYRVRMVPSAVGDDGQMEFVFLEGCGRAQVLSIAAGIFMRGGTAEQREHMRIVRGANLALRTERPSRWQVEGEVGGVTPVECRVLPGALRLIGAGTAKAEARSQKSVGN